MGIKTKIKAKQEEIKAEQGTKQEKKTILDIIKRYAVAVVLTQAILCSVVYFTADQIIVVYDKLTAPKTKTIIIRQAQASEIVAPVVKDESIKDIIKRIAKEQNFDNSELLIKIAQCESSLDRYAENDLSSATGLFQILDMHGLTVVERMNPEIATLWAIAKIEAGGLNAWNESKHCWGS